MNFYHNYKKTNYPEIFEFTSWGQSYTDCTDEIINNRNNFIDTFNIKRYVSGFNSYLNNKFFPCEFVDAEWEIYMDDNLNYVLVSSEIGDSDKIWVSGWDVWHSLISTNDTTHIKIIKVDHNVYIEWFKARVQFTSANWICIDNAFSDLQRWTKGKRKETITKECLWETSTNMLMFPIDYSNMYFKNLWVI